MRKWTIIYTPDTKQKQIIQTQTTTNNYQDVSGLRLHHWPFWDQVHHICDAQMNGNRCASTSCRKRMPMIKKTVFLYFLQWLHTHLYFSFLNYFCNDLHTFLCCFQYRGRRKSLHRHLSRNRFCSGATGAEKKYHCTAKISRNRYGSVVAHVFFQGHYLLGRFVRPVWGTTREPKKSSPDATKAINEAQSRQQQEAESGTPAATKQQQQERRQQRQQQQDAVWR